MPIDRLIIDQFTKIVYEVIMQHEDENNLTEWLDQPTHDDAIEMMQTKAVVVFGMQFWPM